VDQDEGQATTQRSDPPAADSQAADSHVAESHAAEPGAAHAPGAASPAASSRSTRQTSAANNAGRIAYGIAIAALIISVAAPFGEDALLGTLNIHTPMSRRVAEATQEVSRLTQRTAELEKQLAAATAQLARQQAQTGDTAARVEKTLAWTRILALVQLGAALRRPGPFDLELAMVRSSGAAPPELDPLLVKVAPYAATGVPGIAQLQRDFMALRARVDWNEHGYLPMAWINRLMAWPRGASAAPPAEPSPPDATGQYFRDAARELGKDDLRGALAVAQKVGGLAREMLSDWMEDAEARVALDDLARSVNDLVVQRLGGTVGQPVHRQ